MLNDQSSQSLYLPQPLPHPNIKDLREQKFGRLIVKAYAYRDKRGHAYWLCHCLCGTMHTALGSNLIQGSIQSCGCLLNRDKRKDLTGQPFGQLIVQSMTWSRGHGKAHCLCICGAFHTVSVSNLMSGHTTSCGCLKKDRNRPDLQARRHTPEEIRAQGRLNRHIRRARKRNAPNDFTRVDALFLRQWWGDQCAICKATPDFWRFIAWDHWIPLSATNTLGTVPENIVPLCHAKKGASPVTGLAACNSSKHDNDPTEWLIQRLGSRKAKAKLREIERYFSVTRRRQEALTG